MADRLPVWHRPSRGIIRPALCAFITFAGTALAVAGTMWERARRG